QLLEQLDGSGIDRGGLAGAVAELRAPVRNRAPGGGIEDEADTARSGDREIILVVLDEFCSALLVLQEYERGEMRELDTFMEDQRGFQSAVRQESAAAELRQVVAILGHVPSPNISD